MQIQHFFDPRTSTLTYLVYDLEEKSAVLIDPVLDYEPKAARIFFESAEKVARFVDERGLALSHVLDTHAHADHLTALDWFRSRYGALTGIGSGITEIQKAFAKLFYLGEEFATDGSQFDLLLEDGQRLDLGPFAVEAIPTGGHTPASLSYRIGDAVFVGDSLFQPDAGTARCDFPGGSAAELYDSVQRLFGLPDETRLFTLHDYQPGGRELAFESTVAEQKQHNVHIHQGMSKEAFIALREKLERGKEAPTLILPSLQVNIRAGRLPEPDSNGIRYFRIPLNAFGT